MKRGPIPVVIIIAVSFLVYASSLSNGFVYDDLQEVLANKWLTDLAYIPEIFSSADWDFMGKGYPSDFYRPTLHFSFLVINTLFGFKAWAFHLQNIVFHSLNAILLYLIALRIFIGPGFDKNKITPSQRFYALASALVFATHPINSEPILWVSSISDLHFAFFALLSVYFQIRKENGTSVASVVFFFLSAICKETAAVVPLILIGYDVIIRRISISAVSTWVKRYAPFVVAGVIYTFIRSSALGVLTPSEDKYAFLSVGQYVMNVAVLFALHVWKLIVPTGLTVAHTFTPALSISEPQALAAFALIAIIVFLFAYGLKRDKTLSFLLLWIALPTFPVLMFSYRDYPFSERYLYFSSAAFALVLAFYLYRLKDLSAKVAIFLPIALIIVYSVAVFMRIPVWKEEATLWADAAEKSPEHARAHYSLGYALYKKEMYGEAIEAYKRAISLLPNIRDWHYDLALAYQENAQIDDAIFEYQEAIRLGLSSDVNTRLNLGNAYAAKGLYAEAVNQYETALAISPDNSVVLANLRIVLARMARQTTLPRR